MRIIDSKEIYTKLEEVGRDCYTVVLEDCVSSNRPAANKASLEQMKLIADVVPAAELINIWK